MEKIQTVIIDKEKDNIEKISSLLKDVSDLEVIQTSSTLKDLKILLDDRMVSIALIGPSFGLDDLGKLLKANSNALRFVKVILLVKKTTAEHLRKAIKLNIHDVLEFPFKFEDFNESVERAVNTFSEITI